MISPYRDIIFLFRRSVILLFCLAPAGFCFAKTIEPLQALFQAPCNISRAHLLSSLQNLFLSFLPLLKIRYYRLMYIYFTLFYMSCPNINKNFYYRYLFYIICNILLLFFVYSFLIQSNIDCKNNTQFQFGFEF